MSHKNMVVLSDEARKALSKMMKESGMSAEELVTIAIANLADSDTILKKDEHDRLAATIRDAIGEHTDEYDIDGLVRAIAHADLHQYVLGGDIGMRTDNRNRRYLCVTTTCFMLDDYRA